MLELAIPILFMVALIAIKGEFNQTEEPKVIPEETPAPMPLISHLLDHTVYPNVLCHDNNLFLRCYCDSQEQIEGGEDGDGLQFSYYGLWQDEPYHPGTLYFGSMHHWLYKAGLCGLVEGFVQLFADGTIYTSVELSGDTEAYIAFIEEYAEKTNMTTTDLSMSMWGHYEALCGESTGDIDEIHNAALFFLDVISEDQLVSLMKDTINMQGTIAEDEIDTKCEKQTLAILPEEDDDTLSALVSSFELFIEEKYPALLDFVQTFNSQTELEDHISQRNYPKDSAVQPKIGAAVVFSAGSPNWDYTVRSNFTKTNKWDYWQYNVPRTDTITYWDMRQYDENPEGLDEEPYAGGPFNMLYWQSNNLAIQMLVDEFIFTYEQEDGGKLEGATFFRLPNYLLGNFPSPAYEELAFWEMMSMTFAIFMVIGMILPILFMIRAIVQEKELKLKEGMRAMGLNPIAHTLSWWAHFVILFLSLAILLTMVSGPLFEHSDSNLVFWYFMSFFLASISFSFFISAFFNRATVASILGIMVFFLSLFPYFGVADGSNSQKLGACILPATCFALGTDAFAVFEDAGVGVTTYTANDGSEGLPFNSVILMMFLDWVLYAFLGWYCNQVIPSTWGVNRKWNFLFQKSYWMPKSVGGETLQQARDVLISREESVNNQNVQAVPDDLKMQIDNGSCVAVRKLTKVFSTPTGQKIAVNDFDLTMYSGQITALLGHNGAGKTTVISMLTGMIDTTSGHAFIEGKDLKTQMADIRINLGVCPQHDILFPDLTVREHLRMYACFKGVPGKEVNSAVEKMIIEVDLKEKRNCRAKFLSGGQRRKLSLGIAFMGDSKVVFLDEPTSGMDPYSRRFTWDVIRRNREGRTIILTTHFMDEADLLGDRIAIMADGQLRCCGSSLFLKGRFGVGYNLTLVKKMKDTSGANDRPDKNSPITELPPLPEDSDGVETRLLSDSENNLPSLSLCDEDGVVDLVRSSVPNFKLLSNVGAEMTFQLPQEASGVFKTMLTALDGGMGRLGVESYGISVTTLEEVFIKVAAGLHDEETKKQLGMAKLSRERSKSGSRSLKKGESAWDVDDDWKKERVQGYHLFFLHLRTLITKRFWNYKRDWKVLLLTILLPAMFLLVGLGILQIPSELGVQPAITLDMAEMFNTLVVSKPQNPFYYAPNPECDLNEGDCLAYDLMAKIDGATPVDATELESFDDVSTAHVQMAHALLNTDNEYAASKYGALTFLSSDAQNNTFDAVLHTNYSGCHALPLFMNAVNEALFKLLAGDDSVSITVREHPLPETSVAGEIDDFSNAFVVTMFLLIAYAFVPAGYAQYIIREKSMKTKHQQVVSGVSLNAYWISSYIWDMACYVFGPMILTIILLAAFDITLLVNGRGGGSMFLLLFFYGLALIPFTYMMTFFFSSPGVGTVMVILVNWILGLALPIVGFVLIGLPQTQDIAMELRHFFRLFPQFCLGDGLFLLSIRTWLFIENDPFRNEITGYDLAYLGWETVAYFVLVLLFERMMAGSGPLAQRLHLLNTRVKKYQPSNIDPAVVDEDVRQEEERVESGNAENDVIQIHKLHKAFPNPGLVPGCKEAVKGLTLGIPRGQCFGLLGINGAGKTTTLTILSGEQPPSAGRGLLHGLDIASNPEEVHKLIGYCPQFDAIFTSLTGRENLMIYGRLKGIPENRLTELVNQALRQMSLVEYADRISGSYSGGNKRKLSVAIAMIGGPELIFLDEPSTGMDPVARRFMWDVITKISTERAQCSIILTTHSMEECEALCTRIGIMVDGRLRCLGSAQHLKSRFGLGFQLEIGLTLPNEQEVNEIASRIQTTVEDGRVKLTDLPTILTQLGYDLNTWTQKFTEHGTASILYHEMVGRGSTSVTDLASFLCLENRALRAETFVNNNFKGTILRERQSGKARFEFPAQDMALGQMFGLLEDNREALYIQEYSLSQTTLEQIFNFFASQQEEETGQAIGIVSARNTTIVVPSTENMITVVPSGNGE